MSLPIDVCRYIAQFVPHDIRTGLHLRNTKETQRFNLVMRALPKVHESSCVLCRDSTKLSTADGFTKYIAVSPVCNYFTTIDPFEREILGCFGC